MANHVTDRISLNPPASPGGYHVCLRDHAGKRKTPTSFMPVFACTIAEADVRLTLARAGFLFLAQTHPLLPRVP